VLRPYPSRAICLLLPLRSGRYLSTVKYDSNKHNRRSIRLRGYDYRRYGAYFVTICTAQRACILEDEYIRDAILMTWRAVGKYARAATGDEFVVMPNHVHGIVWLRPRGPGPSDHAEPSRFRVSRERGHPIVEAGSLGAIVRAFKSAAAKRVNSLRDTPKTPVWQRGYHERIVRDEGELGRIRDRNNSLKWAEDRNNPANWPDEV
jgi:putative transposase